MQVGCTAVLALFATLLAGNTAQAQDAIRIGDINSYKAMAANMAPYRKGVDLAVEQINAAGGAAGVIAEAVRGVILDISKGAAIQLGAAVPA